MYCSDLGHIKDMNEQVIHIKVVCSLSLYALHHKVTCGGTDSGVDKTQNQCIYFFSPMGHSHLPPYLWSHPIKAPMYKKVAASFQTTNATHAMHVQYGSITAVAMETSLLA